MITQSKYFISDFIDIQRNSFRDLLQKGLIQEFLLRNPISDSNFEVFFYPEYYQLSVPPWNTREAILKGKTYSSKLFIPVQFTDKKNKTMILKWVFIGELPIMTNRGYFIFNGAPRVIVNQLIRSPGLYYQEKKINLYATQKDEKPFATLKRYYADFICLRGTWLRIEIDKEKNIWAQFKRGRKIPLLWFLHAMGLSQAVIFKSISYPNRLLSNFEKEETKLETKNGLTPLTKLKEELNSLTKSGDNKKKLSKKNIKYLKTPKEAWRYLVELLKLQRDPPLRIRSGINQTKTMAINQTSNELFFSEDQLDDNQQKILEYKENDLDFVFNENYTAQYCLKLPKLKEIKTLNINKKRIALINRYKKKTYYFSNSLENTADFNFSRLRTITKFNQKQNSFESSYTKKHLAIIKEKQTKAKQYFLKVQKLFSHETDVHSSGVHPSLSFSLPFKNSFHPSGGLIDSVNNVKSVIHLCNDQTDFLNTVETSQQNVFKKKYKFGTYNTNKKQNFLKKNMTLRSRKYEDDAKFYRSLKGWNISKVLNSIFDNNKKTKLNRDFNKFVEKNKEKNQIDIERYNELWENTFLFNTIKQKKFKGNLLTAVASSSDNPIDLHSSDVLSQSEAVVSLPTAERQRQDLLVKKATGLRTDLQLDTEIEEIGRKWMYNKFMNSRNYDLGKQGRDSFNRKLGLNISSLQTTLTPQDVLYATDSLLKIEKGLKNVDDIDHLMNRKIRTSGELIQMQIGLSLVRLEKTIREKLKNNIPISDDVFFSELEKTDIEKTDVKQKDILSEINSRNSLDSRLSFFTDFRQSHNSIVIGKDKKTNVKTIQLKKKNLTSINRSQNIIDRNSKIKTQSAVRSPLGLRTEVQLTNFLQENYTKSESNFYKKNKLYQNSQSHFITNTQNADLERLSNTLINSKIFNGTLREFFGTNPLSQFMDQMNPLAEITHKRRLSSMGPGGVGRENAPMAIRSIHPTHYGRICPIETPEGKNTGLVNSLTTCAQITSNGFIETPFYKVYKGQIQKNIGIFYLNTEQEEKLKSAPADLTISKVGFLPKSTIPVRLATEFMKIQRNEVQFIGVSPIQMISVATSLIPFLEHDDANRALMGSNMQRQAVPIIRPERPIVGTGLEGRTACDSGHVLQTKKSGFVSYVSANKIIIYTLQNPVGLQTNAIKF